MLADQALVLPLLACPRCRTPLASAGEALRCPGPSCPLGSQPFANTSGWPILVDFERSIVDPSSALGAEVTHEYRRSLAARLPGPVRRLAKPTNTVARDNIDRLLGMLGASRPVVLVVGGGTVGNGVQALYERNDVDVIGFDVYASAVTHFVADAHQIPMRPACVDAVVCQAVLEHVVDPVAVVDEIRRVLRPGGLVYAEVPFLQAVHAGAYDFTRYTASGLRYLFREFTEVRADVVAGPGTQLLWSIEHLVTGLLRSRTAGRLARILLSWLRALDRLVPRPFAEDSASALSFLGLSAGRTVIDQRGIITYYRGAQQ